LEEQNLISNVGNSFKLNAKHISLSVYKNIPRALQTLGARARIGHILTQSCLCKFRISLTPACKLCQQLDETLQHILKDCTVELPDVKRIDKYDIEIILNNISLWKLAQHINWRPPAVDFEAG
jgi:hypothetical protein